jgi:hypothetical protein
MKYLLGDIVDGQIYIEDGAERDRQGCDYMPWPKGCIGFRLARRGRVVWGCAWFPDGSNGNNVKVARGLPAIERFYDRDTEVEFVFEQGGG